MSEGIWVALIGGGGTVLVVLLTRLINRGPERVSRMDKLENDIGDLRQKLFIAVRFIYQQERHSISHNLPPLPIPDELQDIL